MRYVAFKTQFVLLLIVEGAITADIVAVMIGATVFFRSLNSALVMLVVYIVLAMLGVPVIHSPYAAYLRQCYLQYDRFERVCRVALCLSSGVWLVLAVINV